MKVKSTSVNHSFLFLEINELEKEKEKKNDAIKVNIKCYNKVGMY